MAPMAYHKRAQRGTGTKLPLKGPYTKRPTD